MKQLDMGLAAFEVVNVMSKFEHLGQSKSKSKA